MYSMLPNCDLREKHSSEEQWNKLLAETTQALVAAMPKDQLGNRFWTKGALAAAMAYPRAIQQLRFGFSLRRSMPCRRPGHFTATVETYEAKQVFAPLVLLALSSGRQLDEEERHREYDEIIPFGRLLLPSLRTVCAAQVRLDREVAAMRVSEGLRLYAAYHHGQLPQRLTDINDAELPNNPITGKPFDYEIR